MKEKTTERASSVKRVVGIADMMVASNPQTTIITYSLGSCLGITAYDPETQVGGLLHVMLPANDKNKRDYSLRDSELMFVDSGMVRFLNEMFRRGAKKKNLIIKAAGGASMGISSSMGSMFNIGKRNFVMLRKLLWKNGLLMNRYEIGGTVPRTMWIEIDTGDVYVRRSGSVSKL